MPVSPVKIAVFSFPGSQFNGQVAPALRELIDNDTIHLLDLAFVSKKYAAQNAAAGEQQAAPTQEAAPHYDLTAQFEALAKLRDQGILTEEDFSAKRPPGF